jgi:hypothetical protein
MFDSINGEIWMESVKFRPMFYNFPKKNLSDFTFDYKNNMNKKMVSYGALSILLTKEQHTLDINKQKEYTKTSMKKSER